MADTTSNWNQKTLSSWDRVYGIQIVNTYGQPATCHIQKQTVVVGENGSLLYWTDQQPWDLSIEEAMQDPDLAPHVQQVLMGFEGLTQALQARDSNLANRG